MDKSKLEQYVKENKSSYEIAKLEGKGQSTIRYWLKKHGLKTIHPNKKSGLLNPLTEEEKKEIARVRALNYYYSDKNKINCRICGKGIRKRSAKTKKQACRDCDLKIRKKELKSLTYKMIKVPSDHVGKVNENGWIGEHRYLAQKALGRELNTWEVVHHIDDDKANNDLNNLCVLDNGFHASYHSHCLYNDIEVNRKSLFDFSQNSITFLA